MKNQLFVFGLLLLFAFACTSKEEEFLKKPLSEQSFEFEIYDSLVVDYLGNLILMDISPDQNHFLLIDQNTDSIFVTNIRGEIKYQYKKEGDGPENYNGIRWGNAKFLNDVEYLLPTTSGFFHFKLDGTLLKKHTLDFTTHSALVIPNNDNFILKGQKFYTNMSGRGVDEFGTSGVEYQQKAYQMEILDLQSGEFSPAIRFPKSSKYSNTEKAYSDLEFYRNLTGTDDTLFVTFRSEPKIFGFPFSNLEANPSVKTIPFSAFIEKEPTDKGPKEGFEINDLFLGTINKVIFTSEGLFLIDYLSGLKKDKFNEAFSLAGGDIDKLFKIAEKVNDGGWILFDGISISKKIIKPNLLGNLNKYISKGEIYFSPEFEQIENDFSVIYKTRLISR